LEPAVAFEENKNRLVKKEKYKSWNPTQALSWNLNLRNLSRRE
jgi:hypothetical protein